ncbi:hypothetical protein K505DRAFT_156395 [Melanomma pulvis-pyrius CBS 109.77]|uniref:Uncharacterized protein n=1 Tax=Melanomma pulvis-pyrius CBS 109.77 TaxID=1314802 RepID=A0A6A6WQ59_9PLEO|nr:hypothetical protein K505DRAFT_156395 [Melanomma pulvis-pyrius CBS 109.77]
METVARASKISRVDLRYRHRAQDVLPKDGQEQDDEPESPDDVDEPLLIREQKGRAVMGRAHRMFHRRPAVEPSKVLTVIVDVVATVDASGNVIGLATSTPGLVNVQALPTVVLPSVPAVPPFPSDLTVPAYPWPSGVPTAVLSTSTSPSPTSTSTATSRSSSAVSSSLASSIGFNSTSSRTILSSSFFSSLNSTSSTSMSSLSSSSSSFSSTQSSTQISATSSDPAASTSLGGGGGGPVNTAPAPAETTAPTSSETGGSNDSSPLATPKVVGSVIGSLAGAALFLAIILLLLRRHKRKQGAIARQLTMDDAADSQPMAASGQQMATRRSYVPAGATAFFNRFSGASRSTAETSTTVGGERGFQRISGRKLPSAFSEGMTSEQFAREGKLSGSSFYQDDKGFYGGPGLGAKEAGESSAAAGAAAAKERVVTMPSPARTPTIHHANQAPPPFGTSRNGGSTLSPPHSPNPAMPPRGTLGRSHPSQDGSRNSKFTEDV